MRTGPAGAWLPLVFDLDAPAHPIETRGAERLHVTVTKGHVPLGQVVVPSPVDPMPWELFVDQVTFQLRYAIVERHVGDLGASPDTNPLGKEVSVIVCTKDRPDSLQRCLASIRAAESGPIELIVVENATGTEGVQRISREYEARYVSESVPGLDRARNRGASLARGELLLFTDDDVEVDRNWIRQMVASFSDPLVVAATGLVIPAALDTRAQKHSELFASHGRGTRRRVIDGTTASPAAAGSAGVGASMAFRQWFIASIGGFPEELDAGMPTGTGGDTYAFHRALRSGYRIVYEPAAIVRHWHRESDEALLHAFRANGSGITSQLAHVLWSDRDPSAVTQTLPAVGRYLLKRVLGLEHRNGERLPQELARAEAGGALAGPRNYMRARSLVRKRGRIHMGAGQRRGLTDARIDQTFGAELPTVSVIVPTRGRRDSVVTLLSDLHRQDYPPGWWEIVVAIDGDIDGTAEAIETAGLSVPIEIVHTGGSEVSGRGPGVARNLGASIASGEVLVFLDDDVRPEHSSFLRAHATRHLGLECTVAGPVDVDMDSVTGYFPQRVRNWWVGHTNRMTSGADPQFTDLCTGNFSIPNSTFKRLGGFVDLPRREDWEFSYRAFTEGVTLKLAPEASVVQTPELDVFESLKDRRGEGNGDAAFAQLHPEMLTWLPLGEWMSPNRRVSVAKVLLVAPGLFWTLRPLVIVLTILERFGLRHRWAALIDAMNFIAYWSGVGERIDGRQGWLDLIDAARRGTKEQVAFDLADEKSVSPAMGSAFAIRISVGEEALGVLSPALGGLPWDRARFSRVAKARFFDDLALLGAGCEETR